jgi:hypothetical protein
MLSSTRQFHWPCAHIAVNASKCFLSISVLLLLWTGSQELVGGTGLRPLLEFSFLVFLRILWQRKWNWSPERGSGGQGSEQQWPAAWDGWTGLGLGKARQSRWSWACSVGQLVSLCYFLLSESWSCSKPLKYRIAQRAQKPGQTYWAFATTSESTAAGKGAYQWQR